MRCGRADGTGDRRRVIVTRSIRHRGLAVFNSGDTFSRMSDKKVRTIETGIEAELVWQSAKGLDLLHADHFQCLHSDQETYVVVGQVRPPTLGVKGETGAEIRPIASFVMSIDAGKRLRDVLISALRDVE